MTTDEDKEWFNTIQLGFAPSLAILRILLDKELLTEPEVIGIVAAAMGDDIAKRLNLSPARAARLELMRQKALETLV